MKLYVEGGGDRDELKAKCREALHVFFENAGILAKPRVVVCGGRNKAFGRFKDALALGEDAALLIDSEGPVSNLSPRQALQKSGLTPVPDEIKDDRIHLMVECMEAWFLADRPVLASYFGVDPGASAFPAIQRGVESIPKAELYKCLEKISSGSTKTKYSKGRHSFQLLMAIDPIKVAAAAPSAKRLLDWLKSL